MARSLSRSLRRSQRKQHGFKCMRERYVSTHTLPCPSLIISYRRRFHGNNGTLFASSSVDNLKVFTGSSTQKYDNQRPIKVRNTSQRRMFQGCLTMTRGSPDRQTFDANLTSTLANSLRTILTYTSSERGRMAVPLITEAQSISPFPIKMVVKVGGVDIG